MTDVVYNYYISRAFGVVMTRQALDPRNTDLSQWVNGLDQLARNSLARSAEGYWEKIDQNRTGELMDTLVEIGVMPDELANKYRIEFIGGRNTLNFKFSNNETGEDQVFRIKKGDNSHQILANKRDKLEEDGLISPIYAEGLANYPLADGSTASLSISVTDYIENGSFLALHQQRDILPKKQFLHEVAENMLKMAEAFEKLEEQGLFFSDPKPDNWMIGPDANLIIADFKSLVLTSHSGNLIASPGYIVPEMSAGGRALIIDDFYYKEAHAYLLGANLYEYLTGNYPPDIHGRFNFESDIFKGKMGQQYKALIEGLVNPIRSERMSIPDAKIGFAAIQKEAQEHSMKKQIRELRNSTAQDDAGLKATDEHIYRP